MEIGNKHDGKWHGIRYRRFADGDQYITQWVNGKEHGTEARIAPDGTLWLQTYENGVEKSETEGWCRNYMCANVYIRGHTLFNTHLAVCSIFFLLSLLSHYGFGIFFYF